MIPEYVQRTFNRAIQDAKGGLLEEDYILPQYWIRIEQWHEDCLEGDTSPDALPKAFRRYIAEKMDMDGLKEVKTVWVDNGETTFGSSVTLFRKTWMGPLTIAKVKMPHL